MKTVNKAIIVILFACGTQLIALDSRISSKTVIRRLRNAGIRLWQGFEAVIRSGVNLRELDEKIKEKQELDGYTALK